MDFWTILSHSSDIIGVVRIIGLYVTFIEARKSRRAAEESKKLAEKVRRELLISYSISDLSTVEALIEEVKQLNRNLSWEVLLDRFPRLIKLLISIKSLDVLNDTERGKIQSAIIELRKLEDTVEINRSSTSASPDTQKINSKISNISVSINEIASNRKREVGT